MFLIMFFIYPYLVSISILFYLPNTGILLTK